MTETSYM